MSTSNNNMRFLNRVSLDKFYRNSRNNIEDPLFTGFTFDIDTLNSPLFFALCGDEYYESLRSTGKDTTLSEKIENKLKIAYNQHIENAPDSYEINAVYAKDSLDENHKAGYGLQELYYMDKPIYGAVDYIYMVDKVSEGQYADGVGVTDLGDGIGSNYYLDAKKKIIELSYGSISSDASEVIEKGFGNKGIVEDNILTLKYSQLDYEEQHNKNKVLVDKITSIYERLKKRYDDAEDTYNKQKENIEKGKNNIQIKLSNLSGEASDALNLIGTSTGKDKAVEKINTAYNDFCSYFGGSTDVSSTISNLKNNKTIQIESYDVILNVPDMSSINSDIESKGTDGTTYRSAYEKIFFLQKVNVYKMDISDSAKDALQEAQNKYETETKNLYGVHDGGIIGSENNPAPNSMYAEYKKQIDKYENDMYSQIERQMDEYQNYVDNWDEIQNHLIELDESGYYFEDATRNTTMNNTDATTRPRELFEVPQTVYDMMGFINGMKNITIEHPYVLQSISGLDDAYKKYFEVKDPYMGSGDDKITIECLEFLDLKISSMFNKYFNAVYDRQYRRERVPINLRRFNCSIYVHDIRNFKNSLNFDPDTDMSKIAELALNYMSVIEFKFYDCEIIPEETGGIFDEVSNISSDDMRKTHFTFKYGNCIINFLPFEDLRKYLLENKNVDEIKPKEFRSTIGSENNESFTSYVDEGVDDGNFRRWFDKSVLGNVNNNDYRDYVRHDSSVAVDDHYKTTIVNNFALNSVVNKNKELTDMDDALRRLVVGISASTGVPVKGVTDALNIGFIDPILNEKDLAAPVVRNIGNVNNSKVVDVDTMEYIGTVEPGDKKIKYIDFLGNVNGNNKKGGK